MGPFQKRSAVVFLLWVCVCLFSPVSVAAEAGAYGHGTPEVVGTNFKTLEACQASMQEVVQRFERNGYFILTASPCMLLEFTNERYYRYVVSALPTNRVQ